MSITNEPYSLLPSTWQLTRYVTVLILVPFGAPGVWELDLPLAVPAEPLEVGRSLRSGDRTAPAPARREPLPRSGDRGEAVAAAIGWKDGNT